MKRFFLTLPVLSIALLSSACDRSVHHPINDQVQPPPVVDCEAAGTCHEYANGEMTAP